MPPLVAIDLPSSETMLFMVMAGLLAIFGAFFLKAIGLIVTGWSPRDRLAGDSLVIALSAIVPMSFAFWQEGPGTGFHARMAQSWIISVVVDTPLLRLRSRGYEQPWAAAAIASMVANAVPFALILLNYESAMYRGVR